MEEQKSEQIVDSTPSAPPTLPQGFPMSSSLNLLSDTSSLSISPIVPMNSSVGDHSQRMTISGTILAPAISKTKRNRSRPSKPTMSDDERRRIDDIVSHMELRLTMSGAKYQTVYRGAPRHSPEPIDIFQEFGDAANTGMEVDDEWQDVELTKPGWWFLLHPSAATASNSAEEVSSSPCPSFSQTDLLNFMHVRYEKERGAVRSRRRAPRGPPLTGDINCSLIYRQPNLPKDLYIPAPLPLQPSAEVSSQSFGSTQQFYSSSASSSYDRIPTQSPSNSSFSTSSTDLTFPTQEESSMEDILLAQSHSTYGADYETDLDVELTESDLTVVKKKTSAQFRRQPTNPSEKQRPQPSYLQVLNHDTQHPPITLYELPASQFRIKLNPPLSNFRKRMLAKDGSRLADKPIRTVFHVDRSLFEEHTDFLLVILKHSNVEGIVLYVPIGTENWTFLFLGTVLGIFFFFGFLDALLLSE
jgi:hypothetical protein